MPPPSRTGEAVLAAICSLVLIGFAFLAWRAAGWIGVGVLGLLTVFIAVRFDLEGDRPIGPQMTPGLYASQFRDERAGHAETASRRSALARMMGPVRLAMLLGVLLVVVGFGALFFTEAGR